MIGMSVIQYVWICFQYVSLISKDNKYIPYMVSKSIFICKLFSPKFTIYNIWFVIYVYVYAYTHTHTHTHHVQRQRSPTKRVGGAKSCLEPYSTPARDAQRA